ncbi:MAG TPA: ATP-binding protein [Candidatus Anaerobutyricum faecale]|uniref:ATP-binding protein n=1 Tax=Eubacterium sp. An11 TaxID=1965542 RepID=UPI000B39E621|nr:ATP-binding protein [Eubacterium sp. An11]OUQ68605.1 AAA family ATPase [Eubacterium sp. An11]HJC31583.1 ATP-binding protein [Candidatus Anaerobutyricum faecale]
MYREVSKLILYRNLGEDSILRRLSDIFKRFDSCHYRSEELITDIYREVKKLLDLATTYGFDKNLWHNYLTFVLITNENSFSLTCEKVGASEGSTVNHFAKNDFEAFIHLFHYDFRPIEETLGIDCFSTLLSYKAVAKQERMYNKNVSEKVRALSDVLAAAENADQFFDAVVNFYKEYGVGMFGLNKAFRIEERDEMPELIPINNLDKVVLDDLTGYEIQKKKLVDNTEAFVCGRAANNCLLFGDAGTGKSTSIKAILNEYYDRGLRMIEIYKHQFKYLSQIISHVKNRNYRFIIYMDDLSFEEFEIEYKYLKAVIEGGMETRPDNVLIYATSNRRHLIRETWNDRSDMDEELHRSDTMQEKLSLVYRFGITINFSKPSQKEYFEIVRNLAKKYPQITLSDEELCAQANKWELSHGGISGRTAQQFVNYLAGQVQK